MIKARKGNMIILGLSDENIGRLCNDQPIKFKLKDLKLMLSPEHFDDYEVIIFNGKDEETMALTLNQMVAPQN